MKVIETNTTEITPILSRIRPNTADVPGPANRRLSFPSHSPGGATERPLANEKRRDVKSSIRAAEAPLRAGPSGGESSVPCNSRDGVSPASVNPTRNSNGTEQKSTTVVDRTYPRNAMAQSERTNGANNYSRGQIPKDRDTRPDEEEFKRWRTDRDTRGRSLKLEGKAARHVEERVVLTTTDLVGNENVERSEMPLNGVPASSKNRRKKKKKAIKVHADDQNPSTESENSDDSSEQVQESCALETNPQDCKATERVPTEPDHNRQKKRRRRKLEKQKERSVEDESRHSVDRFSETSTTSSVENDDEHISSTPNGFGFSTIASSNLKDGLTGHKVAMENRKISQKYHQRDFQGKTIGVDNGAIEGSMESKQERCNCKQKVDMDSQELVVCRNSLPTDSSKRDARGTIDRHFHRDETTDETARNICPNESQTGDEKNKYTHRDSSEGNENLPIRNSVYHTISKKLMSNENAKEMKLINRKNIEDFLCIRPNDNSVKPLRSSTLA